jgi:hypothetical protein
MVAEEVSFENAFETTLTAEFGPTDLTADVVAKGTLNSPTILVIEPDDDAQREYVRFNGTFGASSFVTTNVSFRYLVGSAAPSGLTHPSGSIVRMVATGQAYEDLHDRIDAHDNKAAHDALNIDADTLDGLDSTAFVEGSDHGKVEHDALGIEAADSLLLQGLNRAGFVEEAEHTKAQHDALAIDADTVDGIEAAGFAPIAHVGDGGAAHADVVAGGTDGFMLGADKTKLDALPAGTGFGSFPQAIIPERASAPGTQTTLSREDHLHSANAVAPVNIGTANVEGSGTDFVRATHIHRIQDARAVAITGGHAVDLAPSALTAAFTNKIIEVVALPSGWSSALVIVTGSIQYAGMGNPALMNARIVIDTSNGSTFQSAQTEAGDLARISNPLHSFVTSQASIDIGLQAHWVTNSGGTGKYAAFTYFLIRAS